ncbi:MAG: hypothetical protein JWM43_3145 [Acidobacteriaceae bacterium]|nr:hypothetical protein [Acidobacteriaceae bacterium]
MKMTRANGSVTRRPYWSPGFLYRSVTDFMRCMQTLQSPSPCVTVFGSARIAAGDPIYQLARQLGRALGEAGFSVMTGGGPGLMEAANRGAQEAGAHSIGCRMSFGFEQAPNTYMDRAATVRYFFVRKVIMCRHADGFAVLPGGIGTLDEMFEVLTLIQTRRMHAKPIVLLGSEYWKPLSALMAQMVTFGTVSGRDVDLMKITDDIDETVHILKEAIFAPRHESIEHRDVKPKASSSVQTARSHEDSTI